MLKLLWRCCMQAAKKSSLEGWRQVRPRTRWMDFIILCDLTMPSVWLWRGLTGFPCYTCYPWNPCLDNWQTMEDGWMLKPYSSFNVLPVLLCHLKHFELCLYKWCHRNMFCLFTKQMELHLLQSLCALGLHGFHKLLSSFSILDLALMTLTIKPFFFLVLPFLQLSPPPVSQLLPCPIHYS